MISIPKQIINQFLIHISFNTVQTAMLAYCRKRITGVLGKLKPKTKWFVFLLTIFID